MEKKGKAKKNFKICSLQACYLCFCLITLLVSICEPVYAATTFWEKGKAIMDDIYGQIVALSTITAVVTASIALFTMNLSRSSRAVDESRSWLKRIIIIWAVINGLGFIMAYITPFFDGGKWTA